MRYDFITGEELTDMECTQGELEKVVKGEMDNIVPDVSAVKGSVIDNLVENSADALDDVIKSGTYSVGDATYMDVNDDFFRFIQNRADVDPDGYFDAGITEIGTPDWSDLGIFKVFTPWED